MSYLPTPRFAPRKRALGQSPSPASSFHPAAAAWYYLYSWSSPNGWDAGTWVQGNQICAYIGDQDLTSLHQGASVPAWYIAFDQSNTLVLSDNHDSTMMAACALEAGTSGLSGRESLGYAFTVGLPIVGNETINLPIEKLISDAVPMLTNAAWPPLQAKLEAELPVLLGKATPALTSALETELPKLLQTAEQSVLTQLWPQLEPKLLADMEIGIAEAKKTVWLATGLIALSVATAAWWITKKDKPRAA